MAKMKTVLGVIGLLCIAITFLKYLDTPTYAKSFVQRMDETYANSLRIGVLHSLPPNKTLILIISYMRSGTSFLGKIFDESNDTLYVFEPLYTACESIFPEYKPLKFINGETRLPDTSCDMYGVEMIKAYLSCGLGRVDIETLGSTWNYKGKQTARYCACFKGPDLNKCLTRFIEVCQKSTTVVLKVIRTRLSYVLPLLDEFPNLKVIHLVRDPRGIIPSRYSMGEFYHRDVMKTGTAICGNMLRDIETYNNNYGHDRIMQVRYEDIAEQPLGMAIQVYKWVGRPIPENVLHWIKASTRAQTDSPGHLGTSRANSTYTATSWRDKISWSIAHQIDRRCGQVLDLLGYIKLSSQEMLRNWTIHLRNPPGDRQLGLRNIPIP